MLKGIELLLFAHHAITIYIPEIRMLMHWNARHVLCENIIEL
jgi:hypothetical protein